MGALLAEWGLEILFALISAGVLGYAKTTVAKIKKELEESKKEAAEKERQALNATIEVHLEPVYEELEELRKYIRDTENIEKSHMNLIIASYRFRLVQLCKAFLKQEYITPEQLEQLSEFYKLYTGLGGNGSAKIYYDRAANLPVHIPEDYIG
jgi:hypothetical protein